MQKSASSPMLSASYEDERNEASRALPPAQVQRRRPRRSQSHEPAPLKDRLFTALTRFRYGKTPVSACLVHWKEVGVVISHDSNIYGGVNRGRCLK